MDNIDWSLSHLGDGDGPVHTFGFSDSWPSQRVILRRSLSRRQRVLDDLIDHDAVLGVHADQTPTLAGRRHGPVDGCVIDRSEERRVGKEGRGRWAPVEYV